MIAMTKTPLKGLTTTAIRYLAAPFVDEIRHQPCPSRLVISTEAGAVVAMEVLIEQQQVAPVRVFLETSGPTVDAAATVAPAREHRDHAIGRFARHLGRRDRVIRTRRR